LNHENKILIVDDNEANRFCVESILMPLKLSPFQACSGDEALQQILSHNFAVILMDVEMPGLDGYETAKLIHDNKRFKNVPIVMVTAREYSKQQYLQAYEAGAVDFITKPIEPIILINKVKQFVELHQQRLAAQQLQLEHEQSAARIHALINSAGEGILGINLCGQITFANPKAAHILKMTQQELLKSNLQHFLASEINAKDNTKNKGNFDLAEGRSDIAELLAMENNASIHKERWVSAEGDVFYVEFSCEITHDTLGVRNGGVVMFQNVSERREIEQRLVKLANFDSLTNLANRAYFHDALGRAIARSKRNQEVLALLFLDLDHFKNINDTLGHDAGDLLLQTVGERIVASIREGDLTARLGGDEFAVILHNLNSATAAAHVAENIINNIQQPVNLLGNMISASTSIGIAIYDEKTMAQDEFTKAADTAMYAAKTSGRNHYQFFDPEMQKKSDEKNRIQISLRDAISKGELCVFYQPKVDINSHKIVGMEALIRWTTLEGVSIPPDIFIPIAEESGQILELGEWVFKEVCKQIHQWQKLDNFANLVISVNVSAIQLKAGNFHKLVQSCLQQFDFPAQQLELELTETAVMDNPELTVKELQLIHDMGVRISIDDFGTGYSSLNYLKRFPIDVLKIDRCFIKDIGDDKYDEEIIKIMVAIAHTMGVQVVAEGIETNRQLAFLVSIGCDMGQGYLFSKPIDVPSSVNIIMNIHSVLDACMDELDEYMKDKHILSVPKLTAQGLFIK